MRTKYFSSVIASILIFHPLIVLLMLFSVDLKFLWYVSDCAQWSYFATSVISFLLVTAGIGFFSREAYGGKIVLLTLWIMFIFYQYQTFSGHKPDYTAILKYNENFGYVVTIRNLGATTSSMGTVRSYERHFFIFLKFKNVARVRDVRSGNLKVCERTSVCYEYVTYNGEYENLTFKLVKQQECESDKALSR